MEKYRYWDIFDEIPEAWVIDKLNDAPAPSTVFITNGKSPISGQCKRALLRLKFPKEVVNPTVIDIKEIDTSKKQRNSYSKQLTLFSL